MDQKKCQIGSMRKKQRAAPEALALELLESAEAFHLATTTPAGDPVLRVLNGVVVRDWILFHGAFAGEKSTCLERPAVVSVHETVADIPSYFVDPEKACPATTFYRSAQASGVLRDVTDGDLKKEMLTALMKKYQPEGGYEPFSSEIYRKDLRAVRVFGLKVEHLCAKVSLGQDRPAERTGRVVQGLWARGKERDAAAIELVLALSPEARPSAWRRQVRGEELVLCVHPSAQMCRAHAQLLVGQYWRRTSTLEEMQASVQGSSAWVGACRSTGELVGAARATSDGSWVASVFDVVVREDFRGLGLGKWLMTSLLDHPRVRSTQRQQLGTADAMRFYEGLGFQLESEAPPVGDQISVRMIRRVMTPD